MPSQLIDDTYPDLEYSDGWSLGGVDAEFQSTTHLTRQAGAHVLVVFEGISIEVYGTVTMSGAVSMYSVDGVYASTYISQPVAVTKYQMLFFRSPVLPTGKHSLLVTSLLNNTLYLDYFMIHTEDGTTLSLSPSPSLQTLQSTQSILTVTENGIISPTPPFLGSSSLTLSPSTLSFSTISLLLSSSNVPAPVDSQPALATSPSKQGLPVGTIVSASLATFFTIAFISLFLWRYRKKSVKQVGPSAQHSIIATNAANVNPFVLMETPKYSFSQNSIPSPSNKQPLRDMELLSFAYPPALIHQTDVNDVHLTGTMINKKHIKNTTPQTRDVQSSVRTTPASPLISGGSIQGGGSPLSTLIHGGTIAHEIVLDEVDDIPPPAYYHTPMSRGV